MSVHPGERVPHTYAYERRGVTKVENLKSDLSVISTFECTRGWTGNPLSILRKDGSTFCVFDVDDLSAPTTRTRS